MNENGIYWLLTNDNVVIQKKGESPIFINKDSNDFNKVIDLLKLEDFDEIEKMYFTDHKEVFEKDWAKGEFCVREDAIVSKDGIPAPEYLSNKIIEFYRKDLSYKPLVNFWERLSKNPSERSKEQLYKFLEYNL